MAHYEYMDQDGRTATMTREEFVGASLKPTEQDRPLSNEELGGILGSYRNAAYGKMPDGTPYQVVPDAEDVRRARERYVAETGVAYDSLNETGRAAADEQIRRYVQNAASDQQSQDVNAIGAGLTAARQRHEDEWAAWDTENNAGTYGDLLADLTAENEALSNRERFRDAVASIPDEERRAAWMAKAPGIFGEE